MILQRFPKKQNLPLELPKPFIPPIVSSILNWDMFGTDKKRFTQDLEKAKLDFSVGTRVKSKSGEYGKVVYFEELHHQCKKDILHNTWKFILVRKKIVSVRQGEPFTEIETCYYSPYELEVVDHDSTTIH